MRVEEEQRANREALKLKLHEEELAKKHLGIRYPEGRQDEEDASGK